MPASGSRRLPDPGLRRGKAEDDIAWGTGTFNDGSVIPIAQPARQFRAQSSRRASEGGQAGKRRVDTDELRRLAGRTSRTLWRPAHALRQRFAPLSCEDLRKKKVMEALNADAARWSLHLILTALGHRRRVVIVVVHRVARGNGTLDRCRKRFHTAARLKERMLEQARTRSSCAGVNFESARDKVQKDG